MPWSEPKTNWGASSVPTEEDFNRIESNIQDLRSSKEPVISVLPIGKGGTGATTVAGARNALGLGNTSGAVPIASGGTGATTVSSARNNLGLGEAAVLNLKDVGYPQESLGLLLFRTNTWGTSGYFQAGPNSGFQAYWGSVYLVEDGHTSVYFSSHSGNNGGKGIVNGNYSIVTGMVSDSNNLFNHQYRNDIFIYNKSAEGFEIYNDGVAGTAYWFAIGMQGEPN